MARHSSHARRSAQMTSIAELTIKTPGQVRFSITCEKWSLTGEVVSGICSLSSRVFLPHFLMASKLIGVEQWTKKDCRRGKNQESIERVDYCIYLSFLVTVAIY